MDEPFEVSAYDRPYAATQREMGDPRRVSRFKRFDSRSNEPEHLDSAGFHGPPLAAALSDIAWFNRWLGGHRSLLSAFRRAAAWLPRTRPLKVVDIGCGSGDGLRVLARWANEIGLPLELYGLDANPAVIEVAQAQTSSPTNVRFLVGDAFGPALHALCPDVVIANQFFHHFTSEELQTQLPPLLRNTRALVMCDLHRHALAHTGFEILARLSGASPIARHDGLVSIRRGFTRSELEALIEPLPLTWRSIVWRAPFRFEVVLVR